MKELILVRHAKSDWGTEFLKDVDRPLNERGYRDAYFMSRWFSENHGKPAKILSSTATRALNTALIFARTMEYDMTNFSIDKNIYEAPAKRLISIICSQPDTIDSLAIFCHNPGITEACNLLTREFYVDNVPTCGIAGIKFSVSSWQEIADKQGEAAFFRFPKNFKIDNLELCPAI
jgi:phosphohistidine phosphatase